MRPLHCLLALTLAAPLLSGAEDNAPAPDGRAQAADVAVPSPRLGLQLWSLRVQFKEGVAGGIAAARGFGFRTVETAGTYGLAPGDFRSRLEAHGLRPVSAHLPYDLLDRNLPEAIAQAKALGVEYIVVASIPHRRHGFGAAEARAVAEKFNVWGAAIRDAGMKFALHTHGYEFTPDGGPGGETPFDLLVRSTRPDLVSFEMDVFWVAHAGVDPVALFEKYPGRWKMLHLKDLRRGAITDDSGGAPPRDDVPVGEGSIRWPELLQDARKAGIEYYFIEDESVSPLTNIPKSLRYLTQFGL